MSKSSKKASGSKTTKQEVQQILYERIDTNILDRLISAESIDEEVRKQLKAYLNKLEFSKNAVDEGIVAVNYLFSKKLTEKGRLYAQNSLSLQSFKKEIRHALSREFYHDIDMVNAHPRLISQYCHKHDINCYKLDEYINNREKILEKIQKFHKISREDAKGLVLRLCYLGNYIIEKQDKKTKEIEEFEPKEKLSFLQNFRIELEKIAKQICKIEKETYDLVKNDPEKTNKKSTTLSITAQILEHKCLMAMQKFFNNKKWKIGVLCFDGLMVEKKISGSDEIFPKEILKECEEYVKQKTAYNINLDVKPMNIELSFELPEYSDYVHSDLEAQQRLFKLEGAGKFKCCNDILYIFNEKTGMYDSQIETLYYYLIKNKEHLKILIPMGKDYKEENYGESSVYMKKTIDFVRTNSVDNEWIDRTGRSSLGYLLFNNGIYNMKTDEFTEGFNPNIVFHSRIPWDFEKRDKKKVEKAFEITFNRIFEDPKPLIVAVACALAGNIEVKKMYLCPGRTDAGKSKFIKILKNAFGTYIGSFNGESLAYTKTTADTAAQLRWSYLLRFSRILLSSEINMKKKLDGNAIKKQSSGGDPLTARVHGGNETEYFPQYTLFGMFNDIPEIEPFDKAVQRRLEYLEFPFQFVDKKEVKKQDYYRIKDANLEEKLEDKDIIQGFIHIILDGYKDFKKNGLPEFDQAVKEKWTCESKQDNEIKELIEENFEITGNDNDKISISSLKKFKASHKIFKTISHHRFNEILEELKLKSGKTKELGRCWIGIKEK